MHGAGEEGAVVGGRDAMLHSDDKTTQYIHQVHMVALILFFFFFLKGPCPFLKKKKFKNTFAFELPRHRKQKHRKK